jgi:hypothetical protein
LKSINWNPHDSYAKYDSSPKSTVPPWFISQSYFEILLPIFFKKVDINNNTINPSFISDFLF